MTEVRSRFHAALASLEGSLVQMANAAADQLAGALQAVTTGDSQLARKVIEGDLQIDQTFLDIENRWHETMALQTPVAGDLRLMTLILQTGHSVERIGDQAVNIAKITLATQDLPRHETILLHVKEMGDAVLPMVQLAIEALVKRDLQLAMRLPELDDPVDRLNRNMYKEVVECAADQRLLLWAVRMMIVARALERVGDRAVDIGEDVVFLLTGEFLEFTDESDVIDGA